MFVVFVLLGIIYISTHYTQYLPHIQHFQNQQSVTARDAPQQYLHANNHGGNVANHGGNVANDDGQSVKCTAVDDKSDENNATLNYLTQNCNIDINGDHVYFNNCGSAPIAKLQHILGNDSIYAIKQKLTQTGQYPQYPPDYQHSPRHHLHSIATRGEAPKFRFMGNLISQPDHKIFVQLYGRPTWTNSTKYDYYGITKDTHGLTTKLPIMTKHNNFIEEHDIVDIEPLGASFKLYPVGHPDALRYNPYII